MVMNWQLNHLLYPWTLVFIGLITSVLTLTNAQSIAEYTTTVSHQMCNPSLGVWATVMPSDTSVSKKFPKFRGYDSSGVNLTICAPKAGRRCASGYCAPGSYCVFDSLSSMEGTCECIPRTTVDNQGDCACDNNGVLTDHGTCSGGRLSDTCSDDQDCGLETESMLPLTCFDGRCECGPTAVHAAVMTSHTKVTVTKPKFRGFIPTDDSPVALCAPKAGANCASKGYCAPRSYCVYESLGRWVGSCHCVPNSHVDENGTCECDEGFQYDVQDGSCAAVRNFDNYYDEEYTRTPLVDMGSGVYFNASINTVTMAAAVALTFFVSLVGVLLHSNRSAQPRHGKLDSLNVKYV